jgi:hypothetical protein
MLKSLLMRGQKSSNSVLLVSELEIQGKDLPHYYVKYLLIVTC